MARAIDGDELLGIERLLDTDVVRQSKTASWLLDQVLHDIQAMPTLTPPNEWVSVEDRLPEDRQIVLFHQKDGFIYCAEHLAGVKDLPPAWLIDNDSWEGENITHWMALPAPPDSCQPEGEKDT